MQIGVLGPLEVTSTTGAVEIAGGRLRALVAVLAEHAPRPVPTTVLIDALWGERPPAEAINALQSLVSRLRRALGDPELVLQAPAGYRLALAAEDVDLNRFAELARQGRDALRAGRPRTARELLVAANALWRGAPFDGADAGYWAAPAARLDSRRLDVREDLIEAQLLLGSAAEVIAELQALRAGYPLRERIAELLVRSLRAAGRQAEALAAYEQVRAQLADELGVDPSAELQAVHLAMLRGEPMPSDAPARGNLRASLTSFVGRQELVARIAAMLTSDRLVTLVGPGGAGKTRLAAEAAATLSGTAPDGVWLAELAPVTDPGDVAQTVLGSLGMRESMLIERAGTMTPRDALGRLVDALADSDVLLVLDNCEHLIDAAAQLADQLLARCPRLRIVATSREPLGILGEVLVLVPALELPEPDADVATASASAAVRLFTDRAAAVRAGFGVEEGNVAAVVEIVRRLDGLPLAIELAAARLRSLPVEQIAVRLSDRFRLLTGGSRTAMPRHRTLRAVVQWSWELLTEAERMLAERLAVFGGGITPDAARDVCAGAGPGAPYADLAPDAVEELLGSLVDKSLLQVVSWNSTHARYRMLETIRDFGLERMAERDEVRAIRLAHARHFAALVREAGPKLRGAEQLEWMDRLRTERDNILAALKYLGDCGDAHAALEMASTLSWYWLITGSHAEATVWTDFALAVPGHAEPGVRLAVEAFYAINATAWEASGTAEDVSPMLVRLGDIGDRLAVADTDAEPILVLLAPIVSMFVGNSDGLGPLEERALSSRDPWIVAAMRAFRASMAENQGDVETMRADAELSLAQFRVLGDRWGTANSLQVLGQVDLMQGDLVAAVADYREALAMTAAIGARQDEAILRLRLADVLMRQRDEAGAVAQVERSKEISGTSASSIESIFTEIVLLEIARGSGDLDRARVIRDHALARLARLPDVHPIRGHGLSMVLCVAAKLDLDDNDVAAARAHLADAYRAGTGTRDMPIVAQVGVAVAMLAERLGQLASAAEIIGASARIRGGEDPTHLDVARLVPLLRAGLGEAGYADAYARGQALPREEALARIDPGLL